MIPWIKDIYGPNAGKHLITYSGVEFSEQEEELRKMWKIPDEFTIDAIRTFDISDSQYLVVLFHESCYVTARIFTLKAA